jgi:hypothetical protein
MDIYTAAGFQPLYRCPGTTRTSSTSLVGLIETTTAIISMPLCRSPFLLRTDSPSSSSFLSLLFLVSTSNRYNSHGAASRTAQVVYPA